MNNEIIIIGAGPAGLWAAKELADKGQSVTVIEKKKSMDTLLRACSMQFILDDDYEGEGVQVGDGELIFPKSGFSVPYSGKLIPVNNKYYHSPNNHVIRFARDNGNEPFSYKFDKEKMLKDLYDLCVESGVKFLMGTLAAGGNDNGDSVTVKIHNENGDSEIHGAKLIIAEGANAAMCRTFGMNVKRMHMATALCVKFIMEGITGVEDNSWNLYYGRAYHSNSAVIIGPSLYGDGIYEVTITSDKTNPPQAILEKFSIDSPMAENFKNAKIIKKIGCSVKAFNAMAEPCKGNVIVIGDAAAMVEVEVQGGFLCAHHAADAIIKELQGEDGWADYTKWWQDSFEFNSNEYMRVAQGYALVPVYTDDELDYLFGLIEGECLFGTYSQYKTPALIWDSIHKYDEKIKAERPEIFAKMEKMNQMSLSDSIAK